MQNYETKLAFTKEVKSLNTEVRSYQLPTLLMTEHFEFEIYEVSRDLMKMMIAIKRNIN